MGKVFAVIGIMFGVVGFLMNQPMLGAVNMWGLIIYGFLFEWRFER